MIQIKKHIEEQKKHNNLMLIDGLALAFRFLHSGKKDFAIEYVNTVESLANSYKANKIIILGDSGSAWRKSFYPEYKANREEKRKNQTQEEADNFKEFLEEFETATILLDAKGFPFIRLKGCEADDISAYITNNYHNKFPHIWMISPDKDWGLLLRDNVSQFSTVTRKEYTLNNWNEHYPFKHEQFIDFKILFGDAGDNVGKAPGLGIKRAEALLEQYESVWDMPFPLDSHLKYIQNLNEFEKNGGIERNYKLMSLLDFYEEAIGEDNLKEIDKILGEYL